MGSAEHQAGNAKQRKQFGEVADWLPPHGDVVLNRQGANGHHGGVAREELVTAQHFLGTVLKMVEIQSNPMSRELPEVQAVLPAPLFCSAAAKHSARFHSLLAGISRNCRHNLMAAA